MTTMRHGTRSRYINLDCRCAECTAANTAYMYTLRARLAKRTPPTHGASGYKNYACRCQVCTQDHTAKWNAWNRKRLAAIDV